MKYFSFVVWMLLFPISMSIVDYINKKTEILIKGRASDSSDEVKGWAALVVLIIWLGVGWLLYHALKYC